MKKTICITSLGLISLLLLSCINIAGEQTIVGTWVRSDSIGNWTLTFKTDSTFTESVDNYAVDPCSWYGKYSIAGNKLPLEIHEDFGGTTRLETYSYSIDANHLSLTSSNGTLACYTRK